MPDPYDIKLGPLRSSAETEIKMKTRVSARFKIKAAAKPNIGQPDSFFRLQQTNVRCLRVLAGLLTGNLTIGRTQFDDARPAPLGKTFPELIQRFDSMPEFGIEAARLLAEKMAHMHFSSMQKKKPFELFESLCTPPKFHPGGTPPLPWFPVVRILGGLNVAASRRTALTSRSSRRSRSRLQTATRMDLCPLRSLTPASIRKAAAASRIRARHKLPR